jgi:rRNA-processing protein FCF1
MENPILSAPQYYVLDTNTIIDLYFGNLLHKIFQLPCKFVITDLLREELLNPPFNALAEMGLLVEFLTSEEVSEIRVMMGRYPKPSYYDISVLILARSKNTVLITGDEALRNAAADNSVNCHGTCWLIDYLANEGLITNTEAIAAYNIILKKPRYPPKEECKALLVKWKRRQKMLE